MKIHHTLRTAVWRTFASLLLLLCVVPNRTFANPSGGVIIHGDAVITPNGNTLSISQFSDKAIINWDQFSISAGELTRFIQPGKDSAALNRVVTGNPSTIHGQLQSNGKVILINPNGVLVGPGGRIDAGGGFVASSLDVPDAQFLTGGDLTFSGNSTAALTNLGIIVAAEGDVILLSAGAVTNAGTIEAPNGVAGLATGTQVLVKSSGDERILVEAGSASGTIDHSGTIRAAQAELKAMGSAESLAVNVTGLIEATGVERTGGRVLLTGGDGSVSMSGKVVAKQSNGDGGDIQIGGGRVAVLPGAEIDASGANGGLVKIDSTTETRIGGSVIATGETGVGGRVEITGEEVILDAVALVDVSGADGGVVMIDSAAQTRIGGRIVATGETGTGGRVEITGGEVILDAVALVDASGATGGVVMIDSVTETRIGGRIIATGETGDGGQVEITGTEVIVDEGALVDASGANGGVVMIDSATKTQIGGSVIATGKTGIGGRVEITGAEVILNEVARVDVSGATGGGEAFVGGGFQGNDEQLRNAESTEIGSDVVIAADALEEGDAGQVIVWADGNTLFQGDIRAAARGQFGNGGFIEISGKDQLFYRGQVDISSVTGEAGTLLLDPTVVNIIDGPAGGGANSAEIADGVILAGDGGAVPFTITTGDIAAVGGNVLIQAVDDVNGAAGANINAGGDIAFVAENGNVNFQGDVDANGMVQIIAPNGNVDFNNINVGGSTAGADGNDVTIIANQIIGNSINAAGADGTTPGQDGGGGGGVVLFNPASGLINIGSINNAGGNGANGTANSPGGNGGDAGFVSAGNGTMPSSVTIGNIDYGGGDGGDGNPAGAGGTGGSRFVNNDTSTPDGTGPNGLPGTLLSIVPPINNNIGGGNNNSGAGNTGAGNNNTGGGNNNEEPLSQIDFPQAFQALQNFLAGSGFNPALNDAIDLNGLTHEILMEIFGTKSLTDTGNGNFVPGAQNQFNQTNFGFGGQPVSWTDARGENTSSNPQRGTPEFPDADAAIFDSESGMAIGGPGNSERLFSFLETEPADILNASGGQRTLDFLAELEEDKGNFSAEDAKVLSVQVRPEPTVQPTPGVGLQRRGRGNGKGGKGKGGKGGKADKGGKGKGGKGGKADKGGKGNGDDDDDAGDENEEAGNPDIEAVSEVPGATGNLFNRIRNLLRPSSQNGAGRFGRDDALRSPLGEDDDDGGGVIPVENEEDENPGDQENEHSILSEESQRNNARIRNAPKGPVRVAVEALVFAEGAKAEADVNVADAKKALEKAKEVRQDAKNDLDGLQGQLDDVNARLRRLIDGADDFNTPEERAEFRRQAALLAAQARDLRNAVADAQAALAAAANQVAAAEKNFAAAENAAQELAQALAAAQGNLAREQGRARQEQREVDRARVNAARLATFERLRELAANQPRQEQERLAAAQVIQRARAERAAEQGRLNRLRRARDIALAAALAVAKGPNNAVEVVPVDGENAAQLIQQQLGDQIRVDENAVRLGQAENPLDGRPEAFEGPIINQLFQQEQEFVDGLNFDRGFQEGDPGFFDTADVSIREVADSDRFDFFQESHLNSTTGVLTVNSTLLDRETGEFTTTQERIDTDGSGPTAQGTINLQGRLESALSTGGATSAQLNPNLQTIITGNINSNN